MSVDLYVFQHKMRNSLYDIHQVYRLLACDTIQFGRVLTNVSEELSVPFFNHTVSVVPI